MRTALLLLLVVLSFVAGAQERVLIPVAYNGPGAFGSFWETLVGGYNRTSVPWRSPGITFVVSENCPIPEGCTVAELAPGQAGQIVNDGDFAFNALTGFLIRIPAGQTGRPAIWGRFWDENSPPFMTELPTPHESEFTTAPLLLPLVTTGIAPVRTLLRIYDLDGTREVTVRVRAHTIFSRQQNPPGATVAVRPQHAPNLPGYGQLFLNEAFGRTFGAADIEIVQEPGAPPARLWAFITVTDTRTNEVGVVTPR